METKDLDHKFEKIIERWADWRLLLVNNRDVNHVVVVVYLSDKDGLVHKATCEKYYVYDSHSLHFEYDGVLTPADRHAVYLLPKSLGFDFIRTQLNDAMNKHWHAPDNLTG